MSFPSSTNLRRVLTLAAAVTAVSACSERRTAERADSDLSHDLALAGQVNAQPALQDTAVVAPPSSKSQQPPLPAPHPDRTSPKQALVPQSTPVTPTPVPQAAAVTPAPVESTAVQPADSNAAGVAAAAVAPAPEPRFIEPGTAIALNSGMRVCTSTNRVGDKLVATVTSPVTGSDGATVPAGSRVILEVTTLATGDSADSNAIGFRPTSMYINGTAYPVTGTITSTTTTERTELTNGGASDKQKVLGGAIVGAILGQIFGHDTKSTVVGAAAGAATGAVVARAQQHFQSCLPDGAALVLTLGAPVMMN